MRWVLPALGCCLALATLGGCSHAPASAQAAVDSPAGVENGLYRGFDRNDYPGAETMAGLHKTFAFTGYWLNNPPGEETNTWAGKRVILRQQGWGFLVLFNGRLDTQILKAQKQGVTATALGGKDAAAAAAAAQREGFPPQTVLFLDQEEGGGLLDEQAAYLLGWTEAVAATGYRAGVYASGQPVPAGAGKTITTIDDIRARVKAGHLPARTRLLRPSQPAEQQRRARSQRLADRAVAAASGTDQGLCKHLRRRWQLLRPGLPHGLPRHG
jgi:4-hydroxyphenylpyruvate dioxygenase-like putative hemolysin